MNTASKNEPIQRIGVVGAGIMGSGVAQVFAEAGLDVVLMDCNANALDKAAIAIKNGLRTTRLFHRDTSYDDLAAVQQRISMTQSSAAFADVEFVVENVVEKPDIKRTVYAWLDDICPADCVFAANTSAISITRIGSWTQRPEQVVGTHFMNPVPLKSTVEVIRGMRTSAASLATTESLLAQANMRAIVVSDSPGFVSNRVLMLTVNEAIQLVEERVGTAEQVDDIFRNCFGHSSGPLETADLIGLDTILLSIEVLHESFADSKYRPSQLLKRMVDAGLHGRKSGQGFFTY